MAKKRRKTKSQKIKTATKRANSIIQREIDISADKAKSSKRTEKGNYSKEDNHGLLQPKTKSVQKEHNLVKSLRLIILIVGLQFFLWMYFAQTEIDARLYNFIRL